MLKDNIYIRICSTFILGLITVYQPTCIIFVLVPIYFFGNYIEAIVLGIIVDALYGVNGSIIYTSMVFIAFISIEFIKRRMRL